MPSLFDKAGFLSSFPYEDIQAEHLAKTFLARLAQGIHTCRKLILNPFPMLSCLRCVHCICHGYGISLVWQHHTVTIISS